MLKRNLYYLDLITMSPVFLSKSYERRKSKQSCKETYYSHDRDGVSFRNLAEAHDTISYCSKCQQYHELISKFEDSGWLWRFRDFKNFLTLLESFPSHHLRFFFINIIKNEHSKSDIIMFVSSHTLGIYLLEYYTLNHLSIFY